ncbi:hypothetical protein [Actinoplanes subtropicus]|uniref:hypothetical protein n=1 Tax=Actinoplanes subtropicus TaxID=543632 RepID=UPI0004C38F72|nr:hypothetical protein [Actinoplanes subtropicus]
MTQYEHAQQPEYGYDPAYQQAAPPPVYPQAPAYQQQSQPSLGYQQQPPPAYQQQPPPAYQEQPPQTQPAYQQQPPQGPPGYQPQPGYQPPAAYQQQPPPQAPPGYQPPGYQPPGYQPPSWDVPPDGQPAYIVTAGAPGLVVKKSGVGQKLALIAVVALVVLGGGGAFAADAWAKGQVCDAVQGLGDDTAASSGKKGGSDEPAVAELDDAEKALNSRADLLFFHGELKEATHDLADDVDTLKTIVGKGHLDDPDAKTVTQLLAMAASMDSHARKAQRACGLPEKSLLGTTA